MRLSAGIQRTLLPGTQAYLTEVVCFNLAEGNLKVHLLVFRSVLYSSAPGGVCSFGVEMDYLRDA